MKYIAYILGVLLISGCVHQPATSSATDINGLWKGEFNSEVTDQPPMLVAFKFISNGKSLTGKMCNTTVSPDYWIPLENGKIKGNNISFTTTPTPKAGVRELIFKYKGRIEGDEIILTFKTKEAGARDRSKVGRGTRAMGEVDNQRTIGSMKSMMGPMYDISGTEAASASSSSQKITIKKVK